MNKNYKKKEIIVIKIARKMISTTIGAHIPTIAEICEEFQSSRGLVQAAIALLEENGAIILEKQRKTGTILQEKDLRKLFEFAEIAVLSGSMALPFTPILSGLATGVFQSLQDPNFHFTFAFMQGAKNRIYALENGNYDFIVVSKAAANIYIKENSMLERIYILDKSKYSNDYVLHTHSKEISTIQDGMTIAVDPKTTDQHLLTQQLCAGKDVTIVETPFLSTRAKFLAGEVDAVLYPVDEFEESSNNFIHPITQSINEIKTPTILVHKDNMDIGKIISSFIDDRLVASIQDKIISGEKQTQYS